MWNLNELIPPSTFTLLIRSESTTRDGSSARRSSGQQRAHGYWFDAT